MRKPNSQSTTITDTSFTVRNRNGESKSRFSIDGLYEAYIEAELFRRETSEVEEVKQLLFALASNKNKADTKPEKEEDAVKDENSNSLDGIETFVKQFSEDVDSLSGFIKAAPRLQSNDKLKRIAELCLNEDISDSTRDDALKLLSNWTEYSKFVDENHHNSSSAPIQT